MSTRHVLHGRAMFLDPNEEREARQESLKRHLGATLLAGIGWKMLKRQS